jgi:hypothetical protein
MKRPGLAFLVVGFVTLLAARLVADAQPAKVPRLGFLGVSPASAYTSRIEGLRQGLRELGYIEGRNIAIEFGGMQIHKLSGFPTWPQSLSVSTWM